MKFDVPAAIEYASRGELETWIHAYLLVEPWANPGLSDGLKLQQRWWRGPLELPLSALSRCVGPEPGMEFPVTLEYWSWRTDALMESIRSSGAGPLDMPPLIACYDEAIPNPAHLSVRDGNHRMGAYERLGWPTAWVLVWYNSQEEYEHDRYLAPLTPAFWSPPSPDTDHPGLREVQPERGSSQDSSQRSPK